MPRGVRRHLHGNGAHHLRNPLRPVRGRTRLLRRYFRRQVVVHILHYPSDSDTDCRSTANPRPSSASRCHGERENVISKKAETSFQHGLSLIESGKMRDALPFLRSAIEIDRENDEECSQARYLSSYGLCSAFRTTIRGADSGSVARRRRTSPSTRISGGTSAGSPTRWGVAARPTARFGAPRPTAGPSRHPAGAGTPGPQATAGALVPRSRKPLQPFAG